jgi:hypothetical protein
MGWGLCSESKDLGSKAMCGLPVWPCAVCSPVCHSVSQETEWLEPCAVLEVQSLQRVSVLLRLAVLSTRGDSLSCLF